MVSLVDNSDGSVGDDAREGASALPGGAPSNPAGPSEQSPTSPGTSFRQPDPVGSLTNSTTSSSPTSQGQSETQTGWQEQTTNNGWGDNVFWHRDWDPPSNGRQAAVSARSVILGISGFVLI